MSPVNYYHILSLGEPVSLNILKSYSTSVTPLNNGYPRAISANTQPNDHISTSKEYNSFLISSSGALYQSLLASLPDLSLSLGFSGVYGTSYTKASLLNPKSEIFAYSSF